MESIADFATSLVKAGAVDKACWLIVLAIVCMNGKGLLQGAGEFIEKLKRVEAEARKIDADVEALREQRKERAAKKAAGRASKEPPTAALPSPSEEQLMLPPPMAKTRESSTSSFRKPK